MTGGDPANLVDTSEGDETPWQRLSSRMIWVDLAQSVLALTPGAVAIWVLGVEPTLDALWPLAIIAVTGVTGAVIDATRWVFTRYRITDHEVQRRTGVVVRRSRSIRRTRVRSVDTTAKLRHRLSGLRVVTIGAGQQSSAGEAALDLDAITVADARALREVLLGSEEVDHDPSLVWDADAAEADEVTTAGEPTTSVTSLARLRPSWVVYNVFNVWAYLMALGVLWSIYWLATTFGLDAGGLVAGLVDWSALGWAAVVAIGLVVAGAIGVVGLAVNFFTQYWGFELARVRTRTGTALRTRHGLLRTREVERDDARLRGVTVSEPVLWRWLGVADTEVITTGLSVWSSDQPTAILPRTPVTVARQVAGAALDRDPSPLDVALPRHPPAALRRRLWWATATTVAATGLLAWLSTTGVVAPWALWAGAATWPLTLLAGLIAYRALGHAIVGPHVVTRSGLLSRATAALRRDAVSTIAVRQSLLQRRLGLATVSGATAAGWQIYEAPDLPTEAAADFADAAAGGLLAAYLAPRSGREAEPRR